VGAPRLRTISDYRRHKANIFVECGTCPNKSVVDAEKAQRWFHCHQFSDLLEHTRSHFRCHVCRGRAGRIRPTLDKPTHPEWMQFESQWAALVKRLRNW
jgi:hypothetical protein